MLATVGRTALWTAIGGLVLPLVGAIIILACAPRASETVYILLMLLGMILELIALVSGIVARTTPAGRAGLWIAAVSLCLALAWVAVVFFSYAAFQS